MRFLSYASIYWVIKKIFLLGFLAEGGKDSAKMKLTRHAHCICTGGDDFESLNTSINILGSPSQSICTEMVIEFDGRIEPMEMFFVQLRTDDTAIYLGLNETRVFINDSDGTYHSCIANTHKQNVFAAVIEVALMPSAFTIPEGDVIMVCASFSATPLDRNVSLHFSILPMSASGIVIL